MASNSIFIPNQEDISILGTAREEEISENAENIRPFQPDNDQHEIAIKDSISKVDILDFKDEGYLLKKLFNEQECKHYIAEGEKIGFQDIYGCKKEYRNSTRIMVTSQELADILWTRLESFLQPITVNGDPHSIHIHGPTSLLQGTWKPARINKIFRLCKYNPGGHFAPHFDGHFVVNSRERSMKTLMLYLNDEFQDGTTNFVDESQTLYQDAEGKYCAEEKNILYRIRPETGMAIVFNHHRLHEGGAVRDGVKYILRTDIIFKKDDAEPSDPKEEAAFKIIQEAERLEAEGENMRAMELYRKAFKLSPSLEASYG